MNNNRTSVMLSHNYTGVQKIDKWFVSEKLDGVRAWWDGGITRGLRAVDVPWANTEKHGRYREEVICTGLWTRLYQPIQAPDWFLNQLPLWPTDGELYAGRGLFQQAISTIRKLVPIDEEWHCIQYCVFDIPSLRGLLTPGIINTPMFRMEIKESHYDWAINRMRLLGLAGSRPSVQRFEQVVEYLESSWVDGKNVKAVEQRKVEDAEILEDLLTSVTILGAEGLMLRNPNSVWTPKRSYNLLKFKSMMDGEGIVVGFSGGRETDRGSKLLGLAGAIIIEWNSKQFELSGFTNEERVLYMVGTDNRADHIVKQFPGQRLPNSVYSKHFPIGSTIRFKYQSLSDEGIPRFARYWR